MLAGRAAGHDLLVLDAPHLFDREGNPYLGPDGPDWPDNALRFGALGWIAARIGLGDVPHFRPDIVHCHDWQAGLTLAYLAYDGRPRPATVITIHNLAYQGLFPADLLAALHLPPAAFQIDGVEYYGKIGFLKAGLQFADRITTVSPTYAAEMQTPANGFGLDGLLRARSDVITGITNGIDTDVWNPLRDTRIPARFGRSTLPKRAANKAHLQAAFRTRGMRALLFSVSSAGSPGRRGSIILADAAPVLLEAGGAQLAVLRHRRSGIGAPSVFARGRSPRPHRVHDRLQRRYGASDTSRSGCPARPVAIRALRLDAIVRAALRRDSGRCESGRACRHDP